MYENRTKSTSKRRNGNLSGDIARNPRFAIQLDALETIFTSGHTSHGMSEGSHGNWTLSHRGLGLTITRSIVEGAGGRITAGNREHGGSRFALELPLRRAN